MDSSTKKLLNGSIVYFVGNALTQLISLALMRFVTGNITPAEYGQFNLITTIANLAIPLVTIQMGDAVFRFVLKAENDEKRKSYFSLCFVFALISVALIFVGTYSVSCLITPIPHTFLVSLYISLSALMGIYQKIVRSLNRNKVFVAGNIIRTFMFLSLEIILISVFDLGIEALLLAHAISIGFLLIYTEISVRALKFFDVKALSASEFANMAKFSVPLIPNAAFWWLTSSVNNVIVSAKLGLDVNGIYSVSGKFSTVLTMVTSVLNMSWQDTAIAEYGKENFRSFLTKTFNTYVKLIFSALFVIIPFLSLIIPHIVDPAYYDAIPFTPFLLLASGTSTMSGFAAQIFVGQGKTKSLFVTSCMGMISNILFVFALVGEIGLWAAVFGTLLADVVIFAARIYRARKEFAKGIEFKNYIIIFLILAVSIALYLKAGVLVNLIWFLVTVAAAFMFNKNFILDLLSLIFGAFRKKKKEKE